ncbi:lamin tail domain-containing protein [Natronoflexus pectinivorans]|uniref:CHU domain-containing protein n=1 Tax=Natronoflexus pectinivorans TaxID=682526 RepID=A0A4R2GI87_9BACT|nr:lamin tail domain-containing protein [Natronoflexus pectinivorans]TCO08279.1 CHU domain-containing protein [Natronoflexus pectinivorans]
MARLFILFLLPLHVINAQFADDFSDGDFTSNPEWTGLTSRFRIDPQRESLQLNAPAEPGAAWLFTSSAAIEEASWQFNFRFGFNPSSSNYAEVFLASDSNSPENISIAYYLVIGTTADNISLWERRGGRNTRLIEGQHKRIDFNVVEAAIRVTREKGGKFILEVKLEDEWIEEGRTLESQGFSSEWFGVVCRYTATRSTLFWFDDFVVTGEPFRDTIPIVVENFIPVNRYKIEVDFNKPIETLHFAPQNFVAHPGNKIPESITPGSHSNSIELHFPTGIPVDGGPNLHISSISDLNNNIINDTTIFYEYEPASIQSFMMTSPKQAKLCINKPLDADLNAVSFHWSTSGPALQNLELDGNSCLLLTFSEALPDGETLEIFVYNLLSHNGDTIYSGSYTLLYYLTKRNDIVITEIMNNPSPVVHLPDSEYIELYNRGDFPIELNDFRVTVGSRTGRLSSRLIFPGEYLLLVPSTRVQFWEDIPNKMAVTSWPLLPVTGGQIVLTDKYNRVITSVQYSRDMGEAGYKQNGGWALEVKDPDNLSFGFENWDFSVHPDGGTPGEENSVNQKLADNEMSEITGLYLLSDSCIAIEYSKPMEPNHLISTDNLMITPPMAVGLDSIYQEPLFLRETHICFLGKIPALQEFEVGFLNAPVDLSGNQLQQTAGIRFGLPVAANPNDIVINELLYDPPTGGQDFVELYNRSERIIDISSLYSARDNAEGIPDRLIRLDNKRRPFFPGEYLVFTADREWLVNYYQVKNPLNIREVSNLPNYVNDGGVVYLTNVQGEPIDRFDYHPRFHFALLTSTKGVSLERINTEIPANDASNWHSASANDGYATPGRKNSQAVTQTENTPKSRIHLEPEIFIPNQNGMDDYLLIHYAFDEPGYTCSITIYNRAGHPVRHLVNNQLAGTNGFYKWDGTNDNGRLCNTGIYIVAIRYFNLQGKVTAEKKTVVLGAGR